jgi:hypothetical protein
MTDSEQIKVAVRSLSERPPHEDPYPSQFAMEAAVELEVYAALGRVQTQTVGKIIQRAIDKAIAANNGQTVADK